MSETHRNLITEAPVILALDTSSRSTSVAISRGAELILNFGAQLDDNRSARLWSIIDFLLTETGLRIEDIDLFAVCTGPGGFTGLRVGITAAKGFAIAMGKPVVGVTSLEAVAANSRLSVPSAGKVYVLNNAYKGEVYAQAFSIDADGLPVAESEPTVSVLGVALDRLAADRRVLITGDAALANEESIQAFLRDPEGSVESTEGAFCWRVQSGEQFLAASIARLAYFRYKAGRTLLPDALQACYVRGADIKVKPQA